MNYLSLSWKKYHEYAFQLSQKIIKDGNHFDLIVTIARGGLTLAHLLSDFIDLPITTFTISSYHDLKQTTVPKIVLKLGDKLHQKKILLIDDISDTGKTFIRGLQYLKSLGGDDVTTASLLTKTGTTFFPDYFIQTVQKDTWVIFPYEVRETIESLKRNLSKKRLIEISLPKYFVEKYVK